MPLKIAVVGQKGGGTKSTIARAIATTLTKAGWDTLLADMDTQQQTVFEWSGDREKLNDVKTVEAAAFRTQASADKAAEGRDVVIYDGKPHADELAISLALVSDLVLIPTGTSLDDLKPSLRFGEMLTNKGVERKRIVFVANKAGTPNEGQAAIDTIKEWGFKSVSVAIPFKASYSQALDKGRCITEVTHSGLRSTARDAIQEIMDIFGELIND